MARFNVFIQQTGQGYTLWGKVEAPSAAHAREIGALTYNSGKPRRKWVEAIFVRVEEADK